MGERMTCPACSGCTSSVLFAFRDREPCPLCGLSADAALEILGIQATKAEKKIKDELINTKITVDKLQAENKKLTSTLNQVRDLLERRLLEEE